jgi:hypothetical protein
MSESDPYAAPDAPHVEEARVTAAPKETVVDSFDQKVDEKPVTAPQTEEAVVPEGSIKEVLAWVGDDSTKAQQALSAEQAGEGRKTLVAKLNEIIN